MRYGQTRQHAPSKRKRCGTGELRRELVPAAVTSSHSCSSTFIAEFYLIAHESQLCSVQIESHTCVEDLRYHVFTSRRGSYVCVCTQVYVEVFGAKHGYRTLCMSLFYFLFSLTLFLSADHQSVVRPRMIRVLFSSTNPEMWCCLARDIVWFHYH